ncbi:MAG TPA: alanine racemase [Candidatus Dormibacteraeota bacterium]|nr:alanine racemase [Candidatus Dormibacteraeota bacterium]
MSGAPGQASARWAEVDLDAIGHNVRQLKSVLDSGVLLAAVVKAGGYGHGAVPVAGAALAAGAEWLAVATVPEALELRAAGITAPVLNLGATLEAEADAAVAADLRCSVWEPAAIDVLERAAAAAGRPARVHLQLDTGMVRLGADPNVAVELGRRIQASPNLELEGLFTHMAEAEEPTDRSAKQLSVFLAAATRLAYEGVSVPILHAANSAAALSYPDARLGMVRCGLPVYGYSPLAGPSGLQLRPALSWKARVLQTYDLRTGDRIGYGGTFEAAAPARTATVSVGYADGYPRSLSNRGELLVRGRRAPVVGRVSMDFLSVDVSDIDGVEVGDEVVVIGRQGDEEITAADVANTLGTIPYEVLTNIGRRVVRQQVPQGAPAARG